MNFSASPSSPSKVRQAFALVLAAAMLGAIGGCDTSQVRPDRPSDSSTEPQATGEDFDEADLFYEPVSLAPGETFSIELIDEQLDGGAPRIVHEGTADGDQRLRARFAPLQPSSVTITCRNEITRTKRTITTLTGDGLATGIAHVAMTDEDRLPDRPGPGVDVAEWSFHHRLLYRLVLGAPGSHTADLQRLYDAVAPVAYQGVTATASSSRRWRRKLLADLRDAGVVVAHETSRGHLWVPASDTVDRDAPMWRSEEDPADA